MPTYEYVCTECDHELEAFQSMKDAPLRKCPSCRKPRLKRRIGGGAGLIFKGSGFYSTDYRPKPTPPPGGDEAKSAPKTESKPAASAAT